MFSRIEEITVTEKETLEVKGELLVSVRRINGGKVKIPGNGKGGGDREIELSPGDFILFRSNENGVFKVVIGEGGTE